MNERLLRQAQRGDDAAYIKLFQQYEQELYAMAYVYAKNKDDALDIVQECAYRSYKAIQQLREENYFKTWLIRILINCAHDLLKKRPHYEELHDTDLIEEPVALDTQFTLQSVMEHLSIEEKHVVLLKYYEDFTFEQIADILQLKLGTTKTILYRALKKLKAKLEEEGMTDEIFER
ncbi:sigma-70 family RNA polymerase sigma factor [Metasolibacillus sp. FSL H7-0170]|uniref:sigma-70 family RNA polymerase sigma factor n=1 Tax=Metasolibacillus TaxID=2703677 RepID=UPI001F1D3144|nr:sigma-70 family RNA polymerase sigma factor [Metasolibacillus fluoroglycofenilyticus]